MPCVSFLIDGESRFLKSWMSFQMKILDYCLLTIMLGLSAQKGIDLCPQM